MPFSPSAACLLMVFLEVRLKGFTMLKPHTCPTITIFSHTRTLLQFSQGGVYKDQGLASADHTLGEQIYGKISLIRKSDAKGLGYFEGGAFLKVRVRIIQPHRRPVFTLPSSETLQRSQTDTEIAELFGHYSSKYGGDTHTVC